MYHKYVLQCQFIYCPEKSGIAMTNTAVGLYSCPQTWLHNNKNERNKMNEETKRKNLHLYGHIVMHVTSDTRIKPC